MNVQLNLFDTPRQNKISKANKQDPFSLIYEQKNGSLYQGDSIKWLQSLETESANLIFADPPYNINKADWDKFDSQERYYATWRLCAKPNLRLKSTSRVGKVVENL